MCLEKICSEANDVTGATRIDIDSDDNKIQNNIPINIEELYGFDFKVKVY